jgi:hypothetical protein
MGINISLPHSGDFQVAVDTISQVCDKGCFLRRCWSLRLIIRLELAPWKQQPSTSAVCLKLPLWVNSLTLHVPQPCHTCGLGSMDKQTGHYEIFWKNPRYNLGWNLFNYTKNFFKTTLLNAIASVLEYRNH